MWLFVFFCSPSVALGVGTQALHTPSSAASSSTWMATSELGRSHLRLPSSHLGELPRGGLHLRPPPHNVDDLIADAVCRFEESEALAIAIDTDAVVCE